VISIAKRIHGGSELAAGMLSALVHSWTIKMRRSLVDYPFLPHHYKDKNKMNRNSLLSRAICF
jgi:hypothetical protein